jgi:putative transposase
MPKYLAHKIRIYPNNKAISYFNKCFGVSRFAYNWGIDQVKLALSNRAKFLTAYDLSKRLNAIKYTHFPWMAEVSKWAVQAPLVNLENAYRKFFKKESKYPRYKKKGKVSDSLYIGMDSLKVQDKYLRIPKLGWIRMAQKVRFPGKVMFVIVSKQANQYFASIQVQLDPTYVYPHSCKNQTAVGVDLGLKNLVTLSTSEKFTGPKRIKKYERKLKRAQQQLAKKEKTSKNRVKARVRVSKIYLKIKNIRQDYCHKLTTNLVSKFRLIAIEDLKVSNMMKNHKVAQSIANAAWYELKHQLEYKAALAGSTINTVSSFFASSKLCSTCGTKNGTLQLSDRAWTCSICSTEHDRDINAAVNILTEVSRRHQETIKACGGVVSQLPDYRLLQTSVKQEVSRLLTQNELRI